MSLSRKEREQLALDIQKENALLARVLKVIRWESVFTAIFILLWQLGIKKKDPLIPHLSAELASVFYWVGLIGAIIFGILTLLSFISYRNGKKHVLKQIAQYQKRH